jgi:hypothetical protein
VDLRTGETGFTINPPGTEPSGGDDDTGCAGPGCSLLLILVLAGLCGQDSSGPQYSSGSGSTSQFSFSAPPPPAAPEPRFAAFTQYNDERSSQPHAVVFAEERIEVIRVDKATDIPRDVRRKATVIKPNDLRGVNRVSGAGTYILHGSIDIEVGPLSHYDEWRATFLAANGVVDRMQTELTLETERGPPAEERVIYIIGTIATVHGPELSAHSTGRIGVIDLRVSPEERARYEAAVIEYERRVEEQRRAAEAEHQRREAERIEYERRAAEARARSRARPHR